jgi:hypothetical protein
MIKGVISEGTLGTGGGRSARDGGAVQIAMADISSSMGTVISSMGAAALMGAVFCSMSMGAFGSIGALGLMREPLAQWELLP